MLPTTDSQSLIDDLDARQNEVLAQLDELNEKIERLLNEVRPPLPEETEATGPSLAGSTTDAEPVIQDDRDDPTWQLPAAA